MERSGHDAKNSCLSHLDLITSIPCLYNLLLMNILHKSLLKLLFEKSDLLMLSDLCDTLPFP